MKLKQLSPVPALVVLENYLDGAVDDYEEGNTDEEWFIMSVIATLQRLGDSSSLDYEKRMLSAMKKRKK